MNNPLRIGSWDFTEWHSFQQISRYYGATTTKRTKLPWINHIIEGVVLIHQLNGSEPAADAFCWHPLIQSDDTYLETLAEIQRYYNLNTSGDALINALGYRDAANRWLRGVVTKDNQPKKHPLEDVNIMLMADKIQNRKDFEANEKLFSVEDASSLHYYFDCWFTTLGITPEIYVDQTARLTKWLADNKPGTEEHKP